MGLTLYHAPGSCAFAPLVALEEAGAAYDLVTLSLAGGDQRRPEHLAIHPQGRVPALVVDGTAVTETVAIISWIHARYPAAALLPSDPLALARAYEIMAWIATTVHVALAEVRRPERFADDPAVRESLAAPGRARFAHALERLERFADHRGVWLVGDRFSAADAYGLVVRRWAEGLDLAPSAYPIWETKAQAALARPAVRRAFEREVAAARAVAA